MQITKGPRISFEKGRGIESSKKRWKYSRRRERQYLISFIDVKHSPDDGGFVVRTAQYGADTE
jgi:hypothetical protein